jgi:predicted choloylglycine hydrolase
MLALQFDFIKEEKAGEKWQALFRQYWPAYREWFRSKGAFQTHTAEESVKALKQHMPEIIPTFEKLCSLAVDTGAKEEEVRRFLSGYNPPAYISGCSQAITSRPPQLVRNYDYHPHLSEGNQLMTAWNGRKVIATNDCLWGAVDGMNEDGLVVSLTFGGKKETADGFGIPFIIRFVLEIAENMEQAVEMLKRLPSHMAYNVAVLNKAGKYRMLQIAPGEAANVIDQPFSTNHQGKISWPEHAAFSKTVEREKFIEKMLFDAGKDHEDIAEAFLNHPLFNTKYKEGFGTVYTAIYRPEAGEVALRWQEDEVVQSFNDFKEKQLLVEFDKVKEPVPTAARSMEWQDSKETAETYDYSQYWDGSGSFDWKQFIKQSIPEVEEIYEEIAAVGDTEELKRGEVPWEQIADFWRKYGESWAKKYSH